MTAASEGTVRDVWLLLFYRGGAGQPSNRTRYAGATHARPAPSADADQGLRLLPRPRRAEPDGRRRARSSGCSGRTGPGKSTALRLVLGFLRPTAGRCTVAGFDCVDAERRGPPAGRVPAGRAAALRDHDRPAAGPLPRRLRGERLRRRGRPPGEAARHPLDKPLTHLSSGMKRKVALLTALVPKVPLIILDEPTNTLDPTMRDELLDQLSMAKERGQAVLFSSHVLHEVEQVCDRVAILRRGEARPPAGHGRPARGPARPGPVSRPRRPTGPHGRPLTSCQRCGGAGVSRPVAGVARLVESALPTGRADRTAGPRAAYRPDSWR